MLYLLKKDKITVEQFGDSFIQLINRINYYCIQNNNLLRQQSKNIKKDKKIN